jgi:hypothetical protein
VKSSASLDRKKKLSKSPIPIPPTIAQQNNNKEIPNANTEIVKSPKN